MAFIHHHKEINDFLIGLNGLQKNIYFRPITIEYDERKRERGRKKEEKESSKSQFLYIESHL
jgi:hypothetical protein